MKLMWLEKQTNNSRNSNNSHSTALVGGVLKQGISWDFKPSGSSGSSCGKNLALPNGQGPSCWAQPRFWVFQADHRGQPLAGHAGKSIFCRAKCTHDRKMTKHILPNIPGIVYDDKQSLSHTQYPAVSLIFPVVHQFSPCAAVRQHHPARFAASPWCFPESLLHCGAAAQGLGCTRWSGDGGKRQSATITSKMGTLMIRKQLISNNHGYNVVRGQIIKGLSHGDDN